MTILIVEDEWVTGEYLKKVVESFGHSVFKIVDNGREALDVFRVVNIDLVFMDININGSMDGLECAKILSIDYKVPVLFVTAYNDQQTIDESLKTNIYGFVSKPFGIPDIEIALRMALKRILDQEEESKDVISMDIIDLSNNYIFDLKTDSLKFEGIHVSLTKTEIKLLSLMASNKDKVLDIGQITSSIWDEEMKSDSTLRNVIYKLRKKIPNINIESMHSMGYMLRTK